MAENYEVKKHELFFDEKTKEDIEDIMTICESASIKIYDKFKLRVDEPKLVGACFIKIFESIIKQLESFEKTYSDFRINICDRLCIGYSTNDNEEDEKAGNFMISITHLNTNKKNDGSKDAMSKPIDLAVQWNTENVINQPEVLRKISTDAAENLKSIDVTLGSSEFILPIFITTYESLINYLKIKRREKDAFEYEINFMSCFYIGARESDEDTDDIYIRPNIAFKLQLKDDMTATAKNE